MILSVEPQLRIDLLLLDFREALVAEGLETTRDQEILTEYAVLASELAPCFRTLRTLYEYASANSEYSFDTRKTMPALSRPGRAASKGKLSKKRLANKV